MITKLILENFLAHGRTELDLAKGLNVLTGPNNIGKSAVVEALRCLAANPSPRHVIRHGANEARVEARFEDGARLAWVRRPRYALYELTPPGAAEPIVFAKFGRTPPEEVLSLLKLNLVSLETGEDVDVHLGNQREPIFLLNKSGAAVAGFFAASSEAAHLLAMQNLLKDRVRKAKNDQRRLTGRQTDVAARLDALSPLPDLELGLEAGRERLEALERAARAVPVLEALLARRTSLAAAMDARRRTLAALAPAAPPPALAPVAPLARLLALFSDFSRKRDETGRRLEALESLRPAGPLSGTAVLARHAALLRQTARRAEKTSRRLAKLADLRPPRPLADAAGLALDLARLRETRETLAAAQARRQALEALAEPPRCALAAELASLAAHLRRGAQLTGQAHVVKGRLGILGRLEPPPVLQDLTPLARTAEALRQTTTRLAAARAAQDERTRRLAALTRTVTDRLAALGACPLCGAELDAAKFLDGGHVHAPSPKSPDAEENA